LQISAEREKDLAVSLWREGDWRKTGKINDVEGRLKKKKQKKDFIISFRLWENARACFQG